MPSTHSSLHYHVVFTTKSREPWFEPEFANRMHSYLGGVVRGVDGRSHRVGGTEDHVHLAFGLKPVHRLSDVVRAVKAESSKWIKRELRRTAFSWQEGYGAFTFGAPDIDSVSAYIDNQAEHHRVRTFQEEYIAMLKRGMVEFDERDL